MAHQPHNQNPVGLKQIAKRAGVSIATVGKVLNQSGPNIRVGEDTRQRVQRIADELGYYPNLLAQQLTGKRSRVLGVLIDSYAPEVRFRQLAAMERHADQLGCRLMVGQTHGEIERIDSYARDFAGRGVDGVVCFSHDYGDADHNQQLLDALAPCRNLVLTGSPPKGVEVPCVITDIREGARLGTRHLAEQGRQTIGLILLSEDRTRAMRQRRAGHAQAHAELGRDEPDELVLTLGVNEHHPRHQRLRRLLPDYLRTRRPDAIFATDDLMAFAVIQQLIELGYRVPEDIAVMGYDNIEASAYFVPALTTIDQQDAAVARAAVELVLEHADPAPGIVPVPAHEPPRITPRLVPRRSTQVDRSATTNIEIPEPRKEARM